MKTTIIVITFLIININFRCYAQPERTEKYSEAIEDNSMLIEEAYNQEYRVVQHISNIVLMPELNNNFLYSFTQEWPVFGLKHQFSYTIPYNNFKRENIDGFGDILINYRYQLSYKQNYVVCSPRLSIIIPSGNKSKGLGNGAFGLQANLPVSKRWSDHLINHFNIGVTYLFNYKDIDIKYDNSLVSYFAGISSIWLVSEKLNLMMECLTNFNANPGFNNKVTYTNLTIISPAIRYAINIKQLQIIPGISAPLTFSRNSKPEAGSFIYLSFEHEF